VKLDVKIPEDKLYSVPLNIRVYDHRGLKYLVGTRSVPLNPFLPWNGENLSKEQGDTVTVEVSNIPGAQFIKEVAFHKFSR
jgi:hypothetical protein